MLSENIVCCRCGEIVPSRQLFAQYHAKIHSASLVEQEKIIVDSIYGESKVAQLVQDYKEGRIGIYRMRPINIAKYIRLLGIKRTASEERATSGYKERYLRTIQEKYGPGITNISQVREVQEKKEKTFAKGHGSYEEYLRTCRGRMLPAAKAMWEDEERAATTLKKIRKSLRDRYGVDNSAQIQDVRERISNAAKQRMRRTPVSDRKTMMKHARKGIPRRWDKPSKIEVWVHDGLSALGHDVVTHARLGRYSIDMVVDGTIALEVQGDVYHANPKNFTENDIVLHGITAKTIWERDARKKAVVESHGYRMLVLWEDEIRQNRMRMSDFLIEKGFSRISDMATTD